MKVYVNLAFLENLFLAEEETDRHFYMKKLLSSSQSAIEIIVDIDIEEVYKDPEKRAARTLLRQIVKKLPISDPAFLVACQSKEFHESGEPKLFFVDNRSLNISRQFGCLTISTNRAFS